MRRVGLKILKNKLSEYVRIAAGGETILVTDRDKVVAELTPPRAAHAILSEDEWIAEQVRKGIIRPATLPPGPPPRPRHPVMSFDELMKEIERDREDG